ncbi:hypothetical protein [Neorhizobium sp. NCHU2750]|uniref:hypothetical protein n=1 Tax=Neorhizobium sp. NCHU2750 TaxID=1825976 RepID=UPI000E76CCC0|nr:hypothetical protein NCHU2750_27020 [Neorhizobium sp. NCHU2750]
MVDPVTPVAATAASAPVKVESSFSIAEPDNAWADARQSQVNADLAALKAARDEAETNREEKAERNTLDDRHPHKRHDASGADVSGESEENPDEERLSGESDRIGTRNFDDKTPFGHRVLIV